MPEHRASSGGVRSLRAMFEQSSDEGATPEARGRSPAPGGGSKVSPESAVSPRPMSKVRTSFVGVEFTEQLGRVLSRGDSAHGASSRAVSEHSEAAVDKTVSHSPSAIRRSIPEVEEGETKPVETMISKAKAVPQTQKAAGPTIEKATPTVGEKGEQAKPGDTKETTALSGGAATQAPTEPVTPLAKKTKQIPTDEHTPSRSIALAAKMSTPQKPVASPMEDRPKAAQPTKANNNPQTAVEAPAASTAASKTLTTSKPPATKPPPPTSRPSNGSTLHSTASSRAHRASARMSTASVSSATSTATNGTRTPGGFVKPKPRSPTRPVKLPAHLTAQTASSAAKHQPEGPPPQKALSKKASTRSLASSIGADGNVPRYMQDTRKRTQQDRDEKGRGSRQDKAGHAVTAPPDENFLARMMRPTASSASKVHGKEEAAPPVKAKVSSRRISGKHLPSAAAVGGAERTHDVHEPIDETEYEHVEAEDEAPNGEPLVAPPTLEPEAAAVKQDEGGEVDGATADAAPGVAEVVPSDAHTAAPTDASPVVDVSHSAAQGKEDAIVPAVSEEQTSNEPKEKTTAASEIVDAAQGASEEGAIPAHE